VAWILSIEKSERLTDVHKMFLKQALSLLLGVVGVLGVSYIAPGAVWYDTNGAKIDAHGGSITLRSGTFYWVGQSAESKSVL
jgi:hypothetical protein